METKGAVATLKADFCNKLVSIMAEETGPTLVQAGHFMLSCSLADETVWPCVVDEMRDDTSGLAHREATLNGIGVFPSASWEIGVNVTAVVAARNNQCCLTTVVNDWQQIPKSWPGGAEAARRHFYTRFKAPLQSYKTILSSANLPEGAIANLGRHGGFISENWLRRRLERHLKTMRRQNLPGSEKLYEETRGERSCIRFTDSPTEAGPLLYEGTTNCAGEIVELVRMVATLGYTTFVNLYPNPCRLPVNEGTRVGLQLFGLTDLRVINVGFPSSGQRSIDQLLAEPIHVNIISHDEERRITWESG